MSLTIVITKTPHPTRSLLFSVAYYLLLTGGVLALVYAGAVVLESHWYQAIEKARLVNRSPGTAPLIVTEGSILGRLEIPRLGIEVIVNEGVSDTILRHAVGHVPQTALPGEAGNIALAGHRDTFFRPLRKIQAGDAIALKTPAGDFEYRVESTVVVAPTDIQVLKPSKDRMLTLVTCFPFSYVGSAPNRFVVRARLVSYSPQQIQKR
jgi:sortase A